ncbi:MAG TPA: hypothetical protein VKY71_03055 [Actinotalea caeni]|nr:hypothetical protein [Actinotalea caeni]
MSRGVVRRVSACIGVLGLLVLGVAAAPASAGTGADEIGAAEWYEAADDAVAEIEATDWAAISAQQGCRLVDVEVTEVVDPELNAAIGAPADLAVPVVEREERCGGLDSSMVAGSGLRTTVAPGSDCSTTSGPGTLCISRSGSYVTTSFRYNGSGTVKAYLRIYKISSSASGCPTGTTLATSSTASYSNGTQRSLSVYAPSSGAFSSYVWRYVALNHYTAWGSACGVL